MPKPVKKPYAATAHRREFGERVRSQRRQQGWTQEQLAEAASMDRSYLADIEAGGRNPTLDIIARIATALEIGISELFE